jgi:DNA-binding response OmpR family regulator
MRYVILLADNDPDSVEARAELLEGEGYTVLKAFSPVDARNVLSHQRVHLAILDIRLTDDTDGDISGLELAREAAYQPLPKIMLTGFPSFEAVKLALAPALEGLPPAVDFLSKKDGPEAMIQAVKRALDQHVRLNWDLQIYWDQREHVGSLQLAHCLYPDLPLRDLVARAEEMEDGIRQLFRDYDQIRIGRLLWHDGKRVCLPVLAQSPGGAVHRRIVICGERLCLADELGRMQEFVPPTADGIRLEDRVETIHFGVAAYLLPGADLETLQPLRDAFQGAADRTLKDAFDHLLGGVLAAWHKHGPTVEGVQDLNGFYRRWAGLEGGGLTRVEVKQRVAALLQVSRPLGSVEIEGKGGAIVFHYPQQVPAVFPDPVAAAYAPSATDGPYVVCRISPGQLTADNILVDSDKRAWLTDFAHAGQAPQWWDFVCLEAAIRFDLSYVDDLLAWQEFERCLVKPRRLDEGLSLQDVASELRKSVMLIERVRLQACSEAGPDCLPYYTGLLAWGVGAMARYDPMVLSTRAERMRGAHLLLATAMLANRLEEMSGQPSPEPVEKKDGGGGFRLDEDGVRVIEEGSGRSVDLTGQELTLFRCLYEHAGQVVSRRKLVDCVFEEAYDPHDKYQQQRLNNVVRRLRNTLKRHFASDRVSTIRGEGYRLE